MRLDQMAVEVRPRTPWEAIDLGFVMARQWFFPLFTLWWIAALPVYLIALLLFGDTSWAALLLLWWCKPLYEPLLTFWLSRALFSEPPRLMAVVGKWWQIVTPRMLANLSWNRLDLNRSFYMPVAVLEGLKGRPRQDRLRVLGRHKQGGTWLTIVGYHLESVLMGALMVLLLILIPEELRWLEWQDFFIGEGRLGQTLQSLAYLAAMSIIAPFYVAAGFALYVTRRTELEAWDIELRFRRIAARARARSTSGVAPLLIGLCLLLPLPPDLQAVTSDRAQLEETIHEVLAHADFGSQQERGYWYYIGTDEEETSNPSWLGRLLEFIFSIFEGFYKGLAAVGETVLWVLAGLMAGFLIYWLYKNRQWLGSRSWRTAARRPAPRVEIFGLPIAPESLPEDILGEALRLLGAGDARGALSLLYRGALSRVIHQEQLEIPASATEGECVQLVDKVLETHQAQLFRRLTQAWVRLAYGHFLPPEAELRQLCEDWRRLYHPTPDPVQGAGPHD